MSARPVPSPRRARRAIAVLLALAALTSAATGCATTKRPSGAAQDRIAAAYADRQSGVQVTGSGTVVRLLADDRDGDRHQRFILELSSGQTLLIAHNIDIAPRVDDLRVGDTVEFHGVYEWSDEGGTVHWTHHDPDGTHEPGWLRHEGTVYR